MAFKPRGLGFLGLRVQGLGIRVLGHRVQGLGGHKGFGLSVEV